MLVLHIQRPVRTPPNVLKLGMDRDQRSVWVIMIKNFSEIGTSRSHRTGALLAEANSMSLASPVKQHPLSCVAHREAIAGHSIPSEPPTNLQPPGFAEANQPIGIISS